MPRTERLSAQSGSWLRHAGARRAKKGAEIVVEDEGERERVCVSGVKVDAFRDESAAAADAISVRKKLA